MGTLDDIREQFGGFAPTAREAKENWSALCVCGHLDRYHSPSTGGIYQLKPPASAPRSDGSTYTRVHAFHGCVGAIKRRDQEHSAITSDGDTQTVTINPTCPCTEFRAIVRVDRANRYFNQQIPADPTEQIRHPFMVGIQAFSTHLSRRRQAAANGRWADEEFERRFTWLEDVRHCGIGHCRATGTDVWPTFVNDELLSELRCGAHRRP